MQTFKLLINGELVERDLNMQVSGAKQSGIGVEKDLEGLAEFTQIQIINV